jgi:hypothetical protein
VGLQCPLQGHAGPIPEEDFVQPTEELLDPGPPVDSHAADIEAEVVWILERTLELDNVACQEAALHGLGRLFVEHRSHTIVRQAVRRHAVTPRHCLRGHQRVHDRLFGGFNRCLK